MGPSHSKPEHWQPDEEAHNCTICNAKFTFYTRKHHCRCCGKVVCHLCSRSRLLLEAGREKPRTCDLCALKKRQTFLEAVDYERQLCESAEAVPSTYLNTFHPDDEHKDKECFICGGEFRPLFTSFPDPPRRQVKCEQCKNKYCTACVSNYLVPEKDAKPLQVCDRCCSLDLDKLKSIRKEDKGESVEWMNQMLAQLWPNISKAATKIVKESVEPEIQAAVPSMLSSIHFSKFCLGDTPPRIERLGAEIRDAETVEFRVDLNCDLNPEIIITMPLANVGIRKLTITGQMIILFGPLLPVSPIIGAVQVYFVDIPHVDFDFTGAGNVADMPGISSALRSVVRSQIASLCVLPNRITTRMMTDDIAGLDMFQKLYDKPPGMLRLKVIGGRNLKAMDQPVLYGKPTSDPYVIVSLGAESSRSKTINQTLDPVWDHSHDFLCFSTQQMVEMDIFDADYCSSQGMGHVRNQVVDLIDCGRVWLPVEDGEGEIEIEVEWMGFVNDTQQLPTKLKDGNFALLGLHVDQAFDLPINGRKSAYVSVAVYGKDEDRTDGAVCKQKKKDAALFKKTGLLPLHIPTPVKADYGDVDGDVDGDEVESDGADDDESANAVPEQKSGPAKVQYIDKPCPNPEWEANLTFLIPDPRKMGCVVFEVMDEKNHCLGTVEYSLEDLLACEGWTTHRRFPLEKAASDASSLKAGMSLWILGKEDKESRSVQVAKVATGCESALWLKTLFQGMWPYIDKVVRQTVEESVVPTIKESLPPMMTFRIKECTLGTRPMNFENFHFRTSEDGGLRLTLDIVYRGDAHFQFVTNLMELGIRNLTIKGRVAIVFKPILDEVPIVGATQVFFVNPPDVDMDFRGLLKAADVPVLRKIIRHTIKRSVCDIMVLPNRIVTPLAEDTDGTLYGELYEPPVGVLRLTVLEGKKLKSSDIGIPFFKSGSSDPYVTVSVGSTLYTTKTVLKSLDPIWQDEHFDFLVSHRDQLINVSAYDEDIGGDDALGSGHMSIAQLLRGEEWIPLRPYGGQIKISGNFFPLVDDLRLLTVLKAPSPKADPGHSKLAVEHDAALMIIVDRAFDVPCKKKYTYASVKVQIITEACESMKYSTKEGKNTILVPLTTSKLVTSDKEESKTVTVPNPNPVWNACFEYLLHQPQQSKVQFELLGWKGLCRKPTSLGVAQVPLEVLVDAGATHYSRSLKLTNTPKKKSGPPAETFDMKALSFSSQPEADSVSDGESSNEGEGEETTLKQLERMDPSHSFMQDPVQPIKLGVVVMLKSVAVEAPTSETMPETSEQP